MTMLQLVRSDDGGGVPQHQRHVDAVLAAVRSEGAPARPPLFKPAPVRPEPSRDVLDHRISEELATLRRRLELLGGILAADPILLSRHAAQLQSIDLVQQVLGHLGDVIASADRARAVELITLTELKARLTRTSLAP